LEKEDLSSEVAEEMVLLHETMTSFKERMIREEHETEKLIAIYIKENAAGVNRKRELIEEMFSGFEKYHSPKPHEPYLFYFYQLLLTVIRDNPTPTGCSCGTRCGNNKDLYICIVDEYFMSKEDCQTRLNNLPLDVLVSLDLTDTQPETFHDSFYSIFHHVRQGSAENVLECKWSNNLMSFKITTSQKMQERFRLMHPHLKVLSSSICRQNRRTTNGRSVQIGYKTEYTKEKK